MSFDFLHAVNFWVAFLGLLGGFALAIPFFFDWQAKKTRRKNLDMIDTSVFKPEDIERLRKPMERRELERVLSAEVAMAALSFSGCVLLFLSFVASLFETHAP